MKLLIANRGEIALRVHRAAASLGWETVAVYVEQDAGSAHIEVCDEDFLLPGSGVQGYLDIEAMIRIARESASDLVHPGYGFLSENPDFAQACADAGLIFVGPSPSVLELFGDKYRAHTWARECGVPVLDATIAPTSLEAAREFFARSRSGVMVKAVSGGGGRGMRAVTDPLELDNAYQRCRSEALRAFGRDEVFLEALMPRAKHVEVQIIGDGTGQVVHVGERECSIQRQNQKLIEWAPSPVLDDAQRQVLTESAVRLTQSIGYSGLATVEFLVNADSLTRPELDYVFIEVNPRIQVEHTVTEQTFGIDLASRQLEIAAGATFDDLGLTQATIGTPDSFSIQCRVNTETVGPEGIAYSTSGSLTAFAAPTGPGVRVETHGRTGMVVDGSFDSLLAKVITTAPTFAEAAQAADTALAGFEIEGVKTSVDLVRSVLARPEFISGEVTTTFLTDNLDALIGTVDNPRTEMSEVLSSPLAGTVVSVECAAGDTVPARSTLLVIEAMKMEHTISARVPGVVDRVDVALGDTVGEGQTLIHMSPTGEDASAEIVESTDLDHMRADLADMIDRHDKTLDKARPHAVAKRHASGHRTARENLDDLCDAGSFIEYGALPVAAQRSRRGIDDLLANTPADGIVTGLARVNGDDHPDQSECVVLAYDYMVLAGTQGYFNHKKTDRMLRLAAKKKVPVLFFAEGGGGRPGDSDTSDLIAAALDTPTFGIMGALSGLVPTVGVLTGRCFAGNAALLGCCDVIIGTRDSTLGMAGPAMIEGGGLGSYTPEEVGPMSVQAPNGVVDILVESDEEAVQAAKKYLSYFQGTQPTWTADDQRHLRHVIPENRLRVYDIRVVIEKLADDNSVMELRKDFAAGAITALVRIEGRAMGVVANNPAHLGGAIDTDAADKMARFLQLCNAHGLPVISLCDTPGFMVGPDAEKSATVRHFSRLFVIGAHLSVPMITVVLRKGYGLGAQAMAAGGFRETIATIAWPTGEIGPMGLEGAVTLGYAKELAAIADDAERTMRFNELVAQHYESGKAINAAMTFELDDVIDPAETRTWITTTMSSPRTPEAPVHNYIDTW